MPTQPYLLKNGKRVPSVTTILGRFKESGALIGWAMKRTREIDLDALREVPENIFDLKNASLAIVTAPTPRDQVRGEADAGTVCHQWSDDFAREKELTPYPELADDMRKFATNGLEAFKRWWDLHQFEVVSSETPLVSEEYKYGGTRDMMAKDRFGDLCALDWKCCNAIYPQEHVPQLAAYGHLELENNDREVQHYHLFRMGKQDASGHHHEWSPETVKQGWAYFKLLRQAYDLSNRLKKL